MITPSSTKAKILLIYSPDEIGVGEKRFKRVIDVFQPLGLGYIAAVLENSGYEVKIIDAKVEGLSAKEISGRVAQYNPAIIGLGVSTPDFPVACSLARQIKSSGEYTIMIGGAHISALPEETMQEACFDYGIVGEGERTVVELADAILKGDRENIRQIKGLVFRDGSKIVRTPPREYIDDLDTLPFPARHLLPALNKYTGFYYKSSLLATIITSRGCPYQCTFCDRAVFGNRVRMRSINNILDEIEMLVKDYGVRSINIPDDLFTITAERIEEFCRQLLSRKLKISWSCFSRVDTVTPQMLKTMKEAGCWMICYGIESGSQRILNAIKKNVTLEDTEKAIKWTHEAGILVLGVFILGVPGENEETLRNTLSFAKKLPLYRVIFNTLQPLPGSEIYKIALQSGTLRKDIDYRYYHFYCFPEKLSFIAEGLTADILKRYRRKAYRDFYLSPAYIFKRIFQYREFKGFPRRMAFFLRAVS
ncbi:MAG: radical SAM protein [Candidatus Omnitrophica bacterium]|nr:radical SAM protein [Candidatus Omnitrophota bacterium]